jgi:hypothetical protein
MAKELVATKIDVAIADVECSKLSFKESFDSVWAKKITKSCNQKMAWVCGHKRKLITKDENIHLS